MGLNHFDEIPCAGIRNDFGRLSEMKGYQLTLQPAFGQIELIGK